MYEKELKIFSINEKKNNADVYIMNETEKAELFEISKLIKRRKYKETLTRTQNNRAIYPNNYFFYTFESLAYEGLKDYKKALNILEVAEVKFPNQFNIFYQLGVIHNELGNFDKALKLIEKSFTLTPTDLTEERSECYNEFGVIYWAMEQKDKAIENWKLAVMENPKNIAAQNNLRDFSNEFDEPAAVTEGMNDVHHFQNIQLKKYLKLSGKKELSSLKEGERVIQLIIEKWNNDIVPQKNKLDTYTAKEKTKWFNSVEIDFSKDLTNLYQQEFDSEELDEYENEFYSIYDGLSEEEILMLPFTHPLLIAMDMSPKRIDALFMKETEPTDYEVDVLDWALTIVGDLFETLLTKDNELKEELLDEAFAMATAELDDDFASRVISDPTNVIKNFLNTDKAKSKTKQQHKTKRRKR